MESYPLGYSEEEARRLAMQGDFFSDLTEDVLRRAGICAGMQVLDVGCGVGDVSLLVRRLIGAEGSVLGIDRGASSVETARRRAAMAGMANLQFETADLSSFEATQRFDAVVGRFVLLYVPDPVTAVRHLARSLKSGGILMFQEMDMSHAAQMPASDFFERTVGLIPATLATAGVEREMGSKLMHTFRRAGLSWPHMIAGARAEGGPQSPIYEYLARTLASLLPMTERAGLASAEEIDIETLADRLRADAVANERITYSPRLVGAWTRV
jgi:ubiquinone/menaquinone biosynthesis C-methylase UbiE